MMADYFNLKENPVPPDSVWAVDRHNERRGLPGTYTNEGIFPERTDRNYHLVLPVTSAYLFRMKRMEETEEKHRLSCSLMEGVIRMTGDYLLKVPEEKCRRFFEICTDYYISQFGRENIHSAVVHMDEIYPHMHIVYFADDYGRMSLSVCRGIRFRKFYEELVPLLQKEFPELKAPRKLAAGQVRKGMRFAEFRLESYQKDVFEPILHAVEEIGKGNPDLLKEQKRNALCVLENHRQEMTSHESYWRTEYNRYNLAYDRNHGIRDMEYAFGVSELQKKNTERDEPER